MPALATAVADVGKVLRFEGALSDAVREFATIATARWCAEPFEWRMHLPLAQKAGARQEAIDALARGQGFDALLPEERIVVDVSQALVRDHALDDDLYARARDHFGEEGLIELVTLVGFYTLLAGVLGTFGVPD